MPYIDGTYYYDPIDNENSVSSGILYSGQIGSSVGATASPIPDSGTEYLKRFARPGFTPYYMPLANEGHDNKFAAWKSFVDSGAIDQYGNKLTGAEPAWGQVILVPDANTGKVIQPWDTNPDRGSDYAEPLVPLGIAALAGLGMGAFGPVGAETAAGSTLADLYGAATNMSVAAAPTAATEGLLYQAATGALPAAGGFAVGNATSPLYQAATGTSVPAGVPDVVGNTLVNQSQYGSLLQSVPEGAVNAFGQPIGQAMSTTPELSQGLLSQAYANGVTPGSTSLWDKLLNGKMPTGGIPTGGMPTGTASGGDDTYTPGPIDQGILGQYGHAVQPGGIMYQGFKTLTPMDELYQQRINKLKGIL